MRVLKSSKLGSFYETLPTPSQKDVCNQLKLPKFDSFDIKLNFYIEYFISAFANAN